MPVELPPTLFETTKEVVRETAAFGVPELLPYALAASGGGGLVLGSMVLAKWLIGKRKEVVQRDAPFPRSLDEARQLREQAYNVEGRCPEFDCAVGRIAEEEVSVWFEKAQPQDKEVLGRFWLGVRNRVDRMMPPSIKEYLPQQE